MTASGPDPVDAETKKARIERINDLSQLARTAWFTLMGYLVFVGITLLGVKDADFFVPSRQTDLPLVNVAIPTASFFWTAPVLGAALYIYLHLFLIKLWDAHGEARTEDADATHHWLVNDFALIRQGDPTARARPLWWLNDWVTRLLVWIAGLFVLAFAWWRSMPAHDEIMTLVIGACLWLSLVVGFTSWWRAESALGATSSHGWSRFLRGETAILVGALIATVSWARTEEGVLLARTDLTNVALVPVPADWRMPETARTAFRETWCKREGLSMEICNQPVGPDHETPKYVTADRRKWCEEHGALDEVECTARFADLDQRFATAWEEERGSARDNLTALDLRGRDLRRARASGVSLIGADLSGARLDHADLSWAQLEAAVLDGASMVGTDLRNARMEDASLRRAEMSRADLREARMERTNLTEARIEHADLRSAELSNAEAQGAQMAHADFREARMARIELRRAQLERADLRDTDMPEADLTMARMEKAVFSGAQLSNAKFAGTVANDAIFFLAQMERTDFRGAQLERADFLMAHMPGAVFWDANMPQANLSSAEMEGAIFIAADLRSSTWADASMDSSLLHFSDLRGAQYLTQDQIDRSIGNLYTLLPVGDAMDSQQPYYISVCWRAAPSNFDSLMSRMEEVSPFAPNPRQFLCADRPQQKLRTGLAIDEPYPPNHPLDAEADLTPSAPPATPDP